MKTYDEMFDSVMSKSEKLIEKKRRRRRTIINAGGFIGLAAAATVIVYAVGPRDKGIILPEESTSYSASADTKGAEQGTAASSAQVAVELTENAPVEIPTMSFAPRLKDEEVEAVIKDASTTVYLGDLGTDGCISYTVINASEDDIVCDGTAVLYVKDGDGWVSCDIPTATMAPSDPMKMRTIEAGGRGQRTLNYEPGEGEYLLIVFFTTMDGRPWYSAGVIDGAKR